MSECGRGPTIVLDEGTVGSAHEVDGLSEFTSLANRIKVDIDAVTIQ